MAFYVLDDNNNRVEAYDKQGVLAVLNQAIKDGSLANIVSDSAFVSKIKCCVSGEVNQIAFVSQQKYNELKANELLRANTYYFITDDESAENINETFIRLTDELNVQEGRLTELERINADTRLATIEESFEDENSVCKQARQTNLTAEDVDTQPNTAAGVSSMDSRYLDISDYMFFYWVGEDGKTYSFGLVKMPSKPATLGEITYSYSPIINTFTYSADVDGYGTEGYTVNNIQIEITCQRKTSSQIDYYYYYTTRVFRYPMFDSSLGTDFKENFANGTLYWRPIR